MAGELKWHVLRVISGQERKISDHIKLEVERSTFKDVVHNILVPTEKIYTIKNGKKTIKDKTLYPGYIYMEVLDKHFTQEVKQQIRQVQGVLGFLGTLNHAEQMKLLGKADELRDAVETMAEPFIVNEEVKIIDGPFNEFMGTIEEVFADKKKLKVIVKIFGRRTPVEVNFMQVEKIS
jgi:transcriptional antiterminator NusG